MSVRLRGACSLWAPEIAVVPVEEGGGFMVLFSVTDARRNCPINFKAAHCPPSLGLITSSPVQPSPAHSVPVQTRPDQTRPAHPAQPSPSLAQSILTELNPYHASLHVHGSLHALYPLHVPYPRLVAIWRSGYATPSMGSTQCRHGHILSTSPTAHLRSRLRHRSFPGL